MIPDALKSDLWKPKAICAVLRAFAFIGTLILASIAAAGESPNSDAINVFHCTFDEEWDIDYDRWPDRWIRKIDATNPHYVQVGIHADKTAPGKKCLRIDLDGAAAAVSSPPVRVMPRFSYVLQANLKNERISHSKVVLTLDFCDSAGNVVQTKRSAPISATKGWQEIQLDQVDPNDPTIDRAVLSLHVERAAKGDLKGRVSLADVRLARKPRIAVSTNNPSNVYTSLNEVVINCELSGIPERDPEIRFQLFDVLNKDLQSYNDRLNGRLIVDGATKSGEVGGVVNRGPDGYEGTTQWRPKIPDYGYYRVVVRMLSSQKADAGAAEERELASRTIYLAVVPPLPMPKHGEFGWTLPQGDSPLSFAELSKLLPQVGINWVKTPIWFDAKDADRANDLIRFVELLGASNIDVVGIIDQPPSASESESYYQRGVPIAELLSGDSATWTSMLEPVMARLSLRVRWWQLGRDGDISFVGFPNLNKRIVDIRTALFRFGQDVRIGLSWDWASLNAGKGPVAWDFEQLVTEAPPMESQYAELVARPRENKALRWVTIHPPSRAADSKPFSEEQLLARSSELVRRMVTAKMSGANGIVVVNPFDDECGLMRASGMPAELLLPWRTTAVMLGGAEYIGTMQLPSGSENHVFIRPAGDVVMVVWNKTPQDETLYLGEQVKQYDIFGRSTDPEEKDGEQTIHVGPTPSFVLGLHEQVTRWRMAVAFEKSCVPSIFSKPHANSLQFRNFFPQGVGGSLKIVVMQSRRAEEESEADKQTPEATSFVLDRWTIEPPTSRFQMAAGAETKFPFEVEFRKALFGKQPVRIDFKVEADQEYAFSVYSMLQVGTEDLKLEVKSHLDKNGTLIVEQLMTNNAEQLADFKCILRARGHRRQRMQVYRLGKELDRKVYRFAGGRELIGKEMLLELEELNGPRELRHRFVAEDMPVEPDVVKNKKLGRPVADEPTVEHVPKDAPVVEEPTVEHTPKDTPAAAELRS